MRDIKVWESIFLIISTIVGLGMFILPSALLKSGAYFFIWFFVLLIAFFILHLVYSEIIFQVETKHNLPGLVAQLISPKLKFLIWFFDFCGNQLVFLVYLTALAKFLSVILPLEHSLIKLAYSFLVSLFIFLNINPFVKLESSLALLEILFPLGLSLYFLPQINLHNLSFQFKDPLLSYGVIIFALTGYSSLQLVYDVLGKNKEKFLKVNLISLLLVGLIYLLFAVSIVGFLNGRVSEETISSLASYLNPYVFSFILVLTSLSIITTFISLAFYLKRGLINDFRLNPYLSWFLVVIPLIIFSLIRSADLVKTADLIGSIFIGINLIMIFICYFRLKKIEYFFVPKIIIFFLVILLSLGWFWGLIK